MFVFAAPGAAFRPHAKQSRDFGDIPSAPSRLSVLHSRYCSVGPGIVSAVCFPFRCHLRVRGLVGDETRV